MAWLGEHGFAQLYTEAVLASDVPFGQDQLGDQYLLRESTVIRLDAETGQTSAFASSLAEFFARVEANIEEYLNVGLPHQLAPGELLHAFPPFCMKESGQETSLRPCPAHEVIVFHAEFARQIRDVPDGGEVRIVVNGEKVFFEAD